MSFSNHTGKPVDAKRSASARKAAETRMRNDRAKRNEYIAESRRIITVQELIGQMSKKELDIVEGIITERRGKL
jgi:hypothetical protein